jgi:serine/threonine protein phosphatase 1
MFSILRNSTHASAQAVPEGVRVYAVGDIHGQLELLEQLQDKIREDMRSCASERKSKIIYLGDYINRGAQSRQIIDHLLDCAPRLM